MGTVPSSELSLINRSRALKVGQTRDEVISILGEPDWEDVSLSDQFLGRHLHYASALQHLEWFASDSAGLPNEVRFPMKLEVGFGSNDRVNFIRRGNEIIE